MNSTERVRTALRLGQPDRVPAVVPYFPLGDSPLALTGPARPGMFVSAIGRRAVALGAEDGPLEIWSWPIKWLHDLELSFRVPKYTTPISGRSVAHAVTERPEGITIEFEQKANIITVSGISKELVGLTADRIRAIRKPEPYKGKGIKYVGEYIRRKAGKTAA